MTKIAFVGAGSFGFTRNLVRDILTFPLLEGATLSLMDIDPERLEFSRRAVQRIVDEGGYPAKVEATLNRVEALTDADAVLCTILAGGVDVWQHDVLIPKKYGIDINVGDTRGVAGIFRALRTIPVMLDIVKDMEQVLPGRDAAQLYQPDGDALSRDAAGVVCPAHRPLPQRSGHGDDARQVDRRPNGRDHVHLRGHQPYGLVSGL